MVKAIKQISLQFPAEELDEIDEAAHAARMSRASWIREACRERLERQMRRARSRQGG